MDSDFQRKVVQAGLDLFSPCGIQSAIDEIVPEARAAMWRTRKPVTHEIGRRVQKKRQPSGCLSP
jgi:hypothetical protein